MSDRIKTSLHRSVELFPHERTIIESFVLDYGQSFERVPLPEGAIQGEPKACFMNAALLALDDDRFMYAEGYAASDRMPEFLHAWCVRDGKAIDLTLDPSEQYEYFGIPIPTPMVVEAMNETQHYGILTALNVETFIDRWKNAAPPRAGEKKEPVP